MVKYYGRAKQRTGTVNTNQIGLNMSGCPTKIGKQGYISNYTSRRVQCNQKFCGPVIYQGQLWNFNTFRCVPKVPRGQSFNSGVGHKSTPRFTCNNNCSIDTNLKIIPPLTQKNTVEIKKVLFGLYGGGGLKLDEGLLNSVYGTADQYTMDIERTLQNLVDRNLQLLIVDVDIYPGNYTLGPESGVAWKRLIKILERIRDAAPSDPIKDIQVIIGLGSRHILQTGGIANRWGINGSTYALDAMPLWKIAITEIGDLKNGESIGLHDYSSIGPFDCLKGIKWNDFSVDYGEHNIHKADLKHNREQIKELHDFAAARNLFIGGISYFAKFNRLYAKDGIELGSSGPSSGGAGDHGTIDAVGLTATYEIPNGNFDSGKTYDLKFLYYNLSAYNWGYTASNIPRLRIICKWNDSTILDKPVDYKDNIVGGTAPPFTYKTESEVPRIFPDPHTVDFTSCPTGANTVQDCCTIVDTTVSRYLITYDSARPSQKLEFILKPNTDGGAPGANATSDGNTVFNVWDITISDAAGNKIKFIQEDGTDIISPTFNPVPTAANKLILGRTKSYNISPYLTPFITMPKWCRYLYNYSLESIYKSIIKNCDLPYYAIARARSWGFDYSGEKIIEQFKKAKEAGAEALLVYNDPTFVNDITINADGTKNFQGIFYNKRPRLTMTRFDQALWWTPHHGTLEGFYQELTTKDTFTAGTKIQLNVKFDGAVVGHNEFADTVPIPEDGGAFNFCITDEDDNAIGLQYINSAGATVPIADGVINSYQLPYDIGAGNSKEWGNWDGATGDPTHVRNSYLEFVIPPGAPQKIKMKLKIREGKMTMSSEKFFGVFIRILVDGDAMEDLTYDYDAGYHPSYKNIYDKVTNYFLTS